MTEDIGSVGRRSASPERPSTLAGGRGKIGLLPAAAAAAAAVMNLILGVVAVGSRSGLDRQVLVIDVVIGLRQATAVEGEAAEVPRENVLMDLRGLGLDHQLCLLPRLVQAPRSSMDECTRGVETCATVPQVPSADPSMTAVIPAMVEWTGTEVEGIVGVAIAQDSDPSTTAIGIMIVLGAGGVGH